MPFDAHQSFLSLNSLDRRDVRRFPQLADQVRCSSGFTWAKGGVLRVLPSAFGTARPADPDDRTQRVENG